MTTEVTVRFENEVKKETRKSLKIKDIVLLDNASRRASTDDIKQSKSFALLVNSIETNGYSAEYPIVVTPTTTDGIYAVVSGTCRLLACQNLGIDAVPCIVRYYLNSTDYMRDNVLSNETRTHGVPVTDIDRVASGYKLYSLGVKESVLRQIYKTGFAQKLYAIYNADKLLGGALLDGIYSGSIKLSSLNKEELRKIVNSKVKMSQKLIDLQDYLLSGETKKAVKTMNRKNIKNFYDVTTIQIFRDVLEPILNGKTDFLSLSKYQEREKALNYAVKLVLSGELTPPPPPEPEPPEPPEPETKK